MMIHKVIAAAVVALALSGFGEEQMFDVKPGHCPGAWRMRWNVGGPMDLSESDGIEFDFFATTRSDSASSYCA